MIVSKTWDLKCGHADCGDRISLHIETEHHSYGLTGGHVNHALIVAAALLGWRREIESMRVTCPKHSELLACARCLNRCGSCVCRTGEGTLDRRFDAVDAP